MVEPVAPALMLALSLFAQTPTRNTQTTSGNCSPAIINTGSGTVKVEITGACNNVDPTLLRNLIQTIQRFVADYPRTVANLNALLATRNAGLEGRLREVETWMQQYRQPIEQARLSPQDAQRWDLLESGEELFGNTIFRMPRGWKRENGHNGGLSLTPQNADFPRIRIEPSEAFDGDFRIQFEQRVAAMAQSYEAIDSIMTAEGFQVFRTNATVVMQGQPILLAIAAAHPPKRFEQITFVNYPGSFEIPSSQLLDPFLASVDYVNSRATQPK